MGLQTSEAKAMVLKSWKMVQNWVRYGWYIETVTSQEKITCALSSANSCNVYIRSFTAICGTWVHTFFTQKMTVCVYHLYISWFSIAYYDSNTLVLLLEVLSCTHPQMWENYIRYTIYSNGWNFVYIASYTTINPPGVIIICQIYSGIYMQMQVSSNC